MWAKSSSWNSRVIESIIQLSKLSIDWLIEIQVFGYFMIWINDYGGHLFSKSNLNEAMSVVSNRSVRSEKWDEVILSAYFKTILNRTKLNEKG